MRLNKDKCTKLNEHNGAKLNGTALNKSD